MKRSKNYYLKRLTHLVEKRIENRDYKIVMMTPDTASGIIEIFDEYLFYDKCSFMMNILHDKFGWLRHPGSQTHPHPARNPARDD